MKTPQTLRLTRKAFLGAGATGSILLLLQGRGGGGSDAPAPAPPAPQDRACGATDISNNHGHTLVLGADQLDATTDLTLNIEGTAGHNHTVVLTAAQLAAIKAGTAVTVDSSTALTHRHTVTAHCV